MKRVFSNREVARAWAKQAQSEGRNSNRSLYFRGSEIYSYGSHYLAAKIYGADGHRFALVNDYKYSKTTARHLSYIRQALTNAGIPYTEVPEVEAPREVTANRSAAWLA